MKQGINLIYLCLLANFLILPSSSRILKYGNMAMLLPADNVLSSDIIVGQTPLLFTPIGNHQGGNTRIVNDDGPEPKEDIDFNGNPLAFSNSRSLAIGENANASSSASASTG